MCGAQDRAAITGHAVGTTVGEDESVDPITIVVGEDTAADGLHVAITAVFDLTSGNVS